MEVRETQHDSNSLIRIFSARACAVPLEKAAELSERQTGIAVEISVCSRHCAQPVAEEATGEMGGDDFLIEIADAGIHDLAIVEAVATGRVDAAFGWTAFRHLEPDRIEVIEMPQEQQVMRGTCVGMLSTPQTVIRVASVPFVRRREAFLAS